MEKTHLNLDKLAGGAFAEKINQAMYRVAENIQNPNTEPTTVREINVKIKVKPLKNREAANVTIHIATKLASDEALETQMVMGVNTRTGKIEVGEFRNQIQGQMTIDEYMQTEEYEKKSAPIDLRAKRQVTVDVETGEVIER